MDGECVNSAGSAFHQLADRLQRAGVRRGDIVVLEGLKGRDLIVAVMAVWQSDAVPLPIASRGTLATQGEEAGLCEGACRITETLSVLPATSGPRNLQLDTTAVLHLSSGSTDRPKVVRRGVASVLQDSEGYRQGLGLLPGDRVAVPLPLAHSFGWGVTVAALLSGCDVDVTPLIRAGTLARKADSGAVSVLAVTPPVARLLIETRRAAEFGPRVAMAGAGPVPDELDDAFKGRFGVPLLRGYGSTETGGTFFGNRGMGRPVPGIDVLAPPPGERGELVLRSAAPIEGCLGDERTPSDEWHTGDIVRHDTDGFLYFEERVRGPLRLNGTFIQAHVTERLLRSVPGVRDVFLLIQQRSDTPELEDFFAVVEGHPSQEDLVAALAGSPAEVPTPRVVVREQLPRTTVGKLDRQALTELVRKVSV
ncbi:class I adenylate-forming enzyme family protein [Streptomyces longwoodensis]|uniref:class I adenylate-forming enzyme family protein n=1 Tax=Streptomyces longwoodensis TaxID=68231 RepID=UPI00225B3D0D|nr:class I adenylate-forming enzyme family protein [Streptomyces longwoodensis]MCX5000781.1 acyl--CoA ligase [Streptomyces longwoodensis]